MIRDTNFDIDDFSTSEIDGGDESFAFVTNESQDEFSLSEEEQQPEEPVDDFSSSVQDINFSEFRGANFKKSFSKANHKIKFRTSLKKPSIKHLGKNKPLSQDIGVEHWADIYGGQKKITKVIVPSDRKTIVQGVSKFILAQDTKSNSLRNIGYYEGRRLQEMVLIFDNNSAIDFTLSLFNPSFPLDYLYSTGLVLNDKIEVNGGVVSYTDLLSNITANPTAIRNAKFVIGGPRILEQKNISLQVQNKWVNGTSDITPVSLALQIDSMQVEGWTINFDISEMLKRPYIPDGMDVINYRVLAGNTVTMCFYYEQKSIKKFWFPDAKIKSNFIDRH